MEPQTTRNTLMAWLHPRDAVQSVRVFRVFCGSISFSCCRHSGS